MKSSETTIARSNGNRSAVRNELHCGLVDASVPSNIEVFESAAKKRAAAARRLVEGHDRHDPRSIERVREIYLAASRDLPRKPSFKIVQARRAALELLSDLDRAGLACVICAPESACDLEGSRR